MRSVSLVLLIFIVGVATAQQKAEIIKLARLQKVVTQKSENIQVVNFWATWCGPCVKELPLFEKFNSAKPENVKITLVSMDLDLDPNPEKVYKFIDKKKILSEVYILDEKNPNDWIDKIEKQWTGALPATL